MLMPLQMSGCELTRLADVDQQQRPTGVGVRE
jgi:hypothetical protein